jgi:hypothetical protein
MPVSVQENSYFDNYPCFYCDKVIISKEERAEHYMTCSEGSTIDENDQEFPDQLIHQCIALTNHARRRRSDNDIYLRIY